MLLSNDGANQIFGSGSTDETLINVNNTIKGAGNIGINSGGDPLALTNDALIDADDSTALIIPTAGPSLVNDGLLEATGSGGLVINNTTIDQTGGGTILASRGDVSFENGAGILGGLLRGTLGGEFFVGGGASFGGPSTTSALTIGVATTVQLDDNQQLNLYGTINNLGTLFEDSTNDQTNIVLQSATVSLTGGGTVLLSNDGANKIYSSGSADETLINVNNTIAGGGELGVNSGANPLALINEAAGVIDADDATELEISAGGPSVTNAGFLEATAGAILVIYNTAVTNTRSGTIAVFDGSTLQFYNNSDLIDESAGTLTGGTYAAYAVTSTSNLDITGSGLLNVDAANVILSGNGSDISFYNNNDAYVAIENSLVSIASGGVLSILGGRGYTTPETLTDAGTIILQNGTFSAPDLTIASGGSFAGFGTILGPITDDGQIEVTDPTLTISGSISGDGGLLIDLSSEIILESGAASGTSITFGGSLAVLGMDEPAQVLSTLVSLIPSDTIDLIGTLAKSATITGGKLIVSLTAGGTLAYSLADPDPLDRAVTSSDGSGGSDITIFREAVAGTLQPVTTNFADHHVGDTVGETLTLSNIVTISPYSENLDATVASHSAGIIAAGSFSGLAPGATNSTSLTAGLVTAAAGVVSGTATVDLYTDGSLVAHDGLGPLGIGSESVTLTGTLYNYATGSLTPEPLSLGEHHVADSVSAFLTLANTALSDGYSENLDASFSGTSADLTASGAVSELGAGSLSSAALALTLHTGTAGMQSGTAAISLISDGSTIDTLGTTSLGKVIETVTGTLYNYATALSAAPNPIDFGIVHVGDTVTQLLTIANIAAPGGYSENLDASFSGTSTGISATGAIDELAAGSTGSTALTIALDTGAAAAISGTTKLGLISDGSTIDTLGTTTIGAQLITITGTVNNYATATVENVSGGAALTGGGTDYVLNFGSVQASSLVSDNFEILNSAEGPADLLSGSFALTPASGFINDGFASFSGTAAGAADTAPLITFSAAAFGLYSETIVLDPTGSNASGYVGTLAPETITVEADVVCFAAGTAIRTPTGDAAVETLKAGNLVTLRDGRAAPIIWLGIQTVSTRFADPLRVLPIRIKAGALAEGLPKRDLLTSPDHAILIGHMLVHAGALVNGVSIIRETNVPEVLTYYHVEVAEHALIFAEDVLAETFVDAVDRLAFDNWAEHEAAQGARGAIAELEYPRAKAHRQLPRTLHNRLLARAETLYGKPSRTAA